MTSTDFRQAALGDDPQVFTKAFAEVNERIAQNPEVAVDDYGTVLRSLEYTSQHCETVTPLAIETYGKFVEAFERTRGMDRNLSPTQALEHLLAYSRHHYYEREAVVEATLESLPRLAAATRHWNDKTCVAAATMVMDRVSMMHERAAFGKLFDTLFETAGLLGTELVDTAHSVIFRGAGVADRAYVQDIFTDRANAALTAMRGTNPSSANLVQRAVEFLQPRLGMAGLNNDLI